MADPLLAIRSRQEVGVVLRNAVNIFMLISECCYGDVRCYNHEEGDCLSSEVRPCYEMGVVH